LEAFLGAGDRIGAGWKELNGIVSVLVSGGLFEEARLGVGDANPGFDDGAAVLTTNVTFEIAIDGLALSQEGYRC
jgi:hypothetical protein